MRQAAFPGGRALAADGLLALAVGAVVTLGTRAAAFDQVPPHRPPDSISDLLIAVAAGALIARRVRPALTLAVTVGTVVVYQILQYPHGPILFVMAISMYSLAATTSARRSLAAAMAALLAVLVSALGMISQDQLLAESTIVVVIRASMLILPWALGALTAVRRESKRRELEEGARRRAYEERLRIAREIHDVVGHGLAVINMQSAIALHVLDRRPEQVQEALEAIKNTSKEALDDLRAALGVFRDATDATDAAAPRRPTRRLGQLGTLATAMAESGLPVELIVAGNRMDIPPGIDLAAYRIVQESLTNTLRHAAATRATVRVCYQPDALLLEITDNGKAAAKNGSTSEGHGIAGMRERAVAVGGTLCAGPGAEGGFKVEAWLPFRAGIS
jgi:signal transduction histidine kinase